MIRKIYLDILKNKALKGDFRWVLRRCIQYLLINVSFFLRRPLCGPILGTIAVTYRCNYHCKMCDLATRYKRTKREYARELSTSEMKKLITDFASLGTPGIGFTGGEPMLRGDIFELLEITKKFGMIAHLNTNGFYLNGNNIKKLLLTGLDSLNISLDGARPETHDSIRGFKGAFKKAVDAIRQVVAAKKKMKVPLRLKAVSVISESNIDEVPDIVTLCRSMGTDCIEFIPEQMFPPLCGRRRTDKNYMQKADKLASYLIRQKIEGVNIENSPRHIKLLKRSLIGEKSPLVCFAGYNSLAVDCYGKIYPCMPWINWKKPVGDIHNISLKKFWHSAIYNKTRSVIKKCCDCHLNCQAELNLLFNL